MCEIQKRTSICDNGYGIAGCKVDKNDGNSCGTIVEIEFFTDLHFKVLTTNNLFEASITGQSFLVN